MYYQERSATPNKKEDPMRKKYLNENRRTNMGRNQINNQAYMDKME